MVAERTDDFLDSRGSAILWIGLLAAPTAWFLNLLVGYLLVPWACESDQVVALHLSSLVALLIAGGGGLAAWRLWRRTGREWPSEAGGPLPRSRFLAMLGLLVSVLSSLIIIAQWIANFILVPCQPVPRDEQSPNVLHTQEAAEIPMARVDRDPGGGRWA